MLLEVVINVLASAILVFGGFIGGKYRERRLRKGRNLEEYAFYPFSIDENRQLFFDQAKFCEAAHHLLRQRDDRAAAQLILVGQQNDVLNVLPASEKAEFQRLFSKYNGNQLRHDTDVFLENFKRIVRLIGDSFPDTGMEILLHDLTNPSKALCYIKNNVTGRSVEAPATNLVLDLKIRKQNNEDKLNYGLTIGARRFKCTTIPIYRDGHGLVGAICINVDVNYMDEVRQDADAVEAFFQSLCKTNMTLDENILSKDEYEKALAGKRHFRDLLAAT